MRPLPSAPWQLAHPELIEISRPAAASGERSIGALDELDEQAPRIKVKDKPITENFNKSLYVITKYYLLRQVEFAIVVKKS